ncbi:hypothetical protein QIS74_13661 [Colletotrichum tabaci]|uniref:Uncharacterized protein n=1 Tax=Colletotrichum tabaci TaxID=1209068 RepID=A0AAV9SSM4_9PEZI
MGAQQSIAVLPCLLRLCSEIQVLRNVKCNSFVDVAIQALSGLPPETQSKIAEKLRQKTEVWNVSGQCHTSAQPELRRELSSDGVSHAVHPTAFPYPMCLSCGALGLAHKSAGSACPGSEAPNRMPVESDPSKISARIENEILKNIIKEWEGSLERFLADIELEPERRDFGLSKFALRPKHPNIVDIVLHRFATRELYNSEKAGSRLENKRLLPVEANEEIYAKGFQYDWCKEHRDLCDSVLDDNRKEAINRVIKT